MEEDVLDKLPYLLRKHTMKGEMEDVEAERKLLSGKQEVFLSKIFAFVSGNDLGDKTLETALSIARRFSCELHVAYDTEPKKETLEKIAKSGVSAREIKINRINLENELLLIASRKGFDLLILPASFGKKGLKKISITTENIVEKAEAAVLVIR